MKNQKLPVEIPAPDREGTESLLRGHTYIAIDMKSFYASVECVYRNLDPLKAKLLVADPSRSDQTICLAVSPALKSRLRHKTSDMSSL